MQEVLLSYQLSNHVGVAQQQFSCRMMWSIPMSIPLGLAEKLHFLEVSSHSSPIRESFEIFESQSFDNGDWQNGQAVATQCD